MTSDEIDTQLRAWWSAGDWARLDPAIRARVRELLPRMGLSQDYDTAEDISAAIVVKCWRYGVVPDSPLAFIATCTRNRARDEYKTARARHIHVDVHEVDLAAPDADTEPVHDREDLDRLRQAIHEVPDLLRRAFVLHEFHNRSCNDLAEQFDTTVGAMKMRLHRARRMIGPLYALIQAGQSLPVPSTRKYPRQRKKPVKIVVKKKRGRPVVHRCRCGDVACTAFLPQHLQG